MMGREETFDEVHDCQEAFRLLLHAIANPGERVSLREQAEKLNREVGGNVNLNREEGSNVNLIFNGMLLLARTLLDRETGFSVRGDASLADRIASATYSQKKTTNVPFLFVASDCEESARETVFMQATPGTLEEPHASTLILVAVEAFSPACPVAFSGPGIDGVITVPFSAYAQEWVRLRDKMAYEYPTGVDLLFLEPNGDMMMIPRKIEMAG